MNERVKNRRIALKHAHSASTLANHSPEGVDTYQP